MFDFDTISLMIGVVGGGALGYFFNYNRTHTLKETLANVRKSTNQIIDALIQEHNLNKNLTQKLASQAKLVK